MKISVISHNLSSNCLSRAHLLATILSRHYNVDIIGPQTPAGIWPPLKHNTDVPITPIPVTKGPLARLTSLKILTKKLDADVIYAVKPLYASFLLPVLRSTFDKTPIVLDIDDWELGLVKASIHQTNLPLTKKLSKLPYYAGTILCENLARFADQITVSNTFLQNRFGGQLVWHARDTEAFNPDRFDRAALRAKYNIPPEKKLVTFFGTPKPHKGIEDLIEAVSLIEDPNLCLMLVGLDTAADFYSTQICSIAAETLGPRFITFGPQPFENVPEFLAMTDIYAIPQHDNPATVGQMPAKVFDAMAMQIPIIATKVSDLPTVLKDAGYLVAPHSPQQIATAISDILNNPEQAKAYAKTARKNCIENYSHNATEKTLTNIFNKYKNSPA